MNDSSLKIFVTGGSGFLGGHVLETLGRRHTMLAMARSEASADKVRAWGAEAVTCSLTDIDAKHLQGADVVIHCAAHVEEWGSRETFWDINVRGTERLVQASRAAGVKRFIHIGTIAAVFDGSPLQGVDESAPYPPKHRFLYGETKQAAEEVVLAANSSSMATLSLRPCFIWGPRDNSLLPAVQRMVEAGSWAWLDGGKAEVSTTHVSNLVDAIDKALTRGEGGEAYFVADEGTRTLREFITDIAAAEGIALPQRSMPGFAARGAASVLEGLYRLFGVSKTPPVTRMGAALMSRTVTVDDSKARAQLGYVPNRC